MKEKERKTAASNSADNRWLDTIIRKLILLMNDCEHRPIGPYEDPETGVIVVTKDDRNFLVGFLSLVEGFKKEDDETASLVKELREMNSRLEEIMGYCFEILDDQKISKVARSSVRALKEEMKLFSEKHGFENSVVIGGKFISMKKLDTREVQYYNRVVRFLQGNVLKDLYQLKPEKTSHA